MMDWKIKNSEAKNMDGQTLARLVKAALAVAGAIGIQIDPEHIEAIASGVAAAYAVITAVEAWMRKRLRLKRLG